MYSKLNNYNNIYTQFGKNLGGQPCAKVGLSGPSCQVPGCVQCDTTTGTCETALVPQECTGEICTKSQLDLPCYGSGCPCYSPPGLCPQGTQNYSCPKDSYINANACESTSGGCKKAPTPVSCYKDESKQFKNNMDGWFLQEIKSGNYLGVYEGGSGVDLFNSDWVKGNTLEWYGIPANESHGHGGPIEAGKNIGLANKDAWKNPGSYVANASGAYLTGTTGKGPVGFLPVISSVGITAWGSQSDGGWQGWKIIGIGSNPNANFSCPEKSATCSSTTGCTDPNYTTTPYKEGANIYDRWIFKIQHTVDDGYCIGETDAGTIGLTTNTDNQYHFQLQYNIGPIPS